MVAPVRDIYGPLAVDRDAPRPVEISLGYSRSSPRLEEFAGLGKRLDAIVQAVDDVEIIVGVEGDPRGSVQHARLGTLRAPPLEVLAVGIVLGERLDAVRVEGRYRAFVLVGGEYASVALRDGNPHRPGEAAASEVADMVLVDRRLADAKVDVEAACDVLKAVAATEDEENIVAGRSDIHREAVTTRSAELALVVLGRLTPQVMAVVPRSARCRGRNHRGLLRVCGKLTH